MEVLPQHKVWWLRALGAADDACYAAGLPHVLDVAVAAAAIALVGAFALFGLARTRRG